MASDFTCSVTSSRDQGAVNTEQLSCTEVVHNLNTRAPRTVDVARVTFPPEKLNLIDINAKRRFLDSQYQGNRERILGALNGIFRNPAGGRATEALVMSDFSDAMVVTGGIYFADSAHDISWPHTGDKTRQGDGFVWFKPSPSQQGHVLSEQQGNFLSGGYLFLDFQGHASLSRLCENHAMTSQVFDGYRLVVQSNIILVANGQEDGNADGSKNAVAALSAQQDGNLSLIVAAEPSQSSIGSGLTYREFGQLLVRWGSKHAINLDGGPSTQFAVRKEGCQNPQNPEACVENLIDHSDETNRMPQLFLVSK